MARRVHTPMLNSEFRREILHVNSTRRTCEQRGKTPKEYAEANANRGEIGLARAGAYVAYKDNRTEQTRAWAAETIARAHRVRATIVRDTGTFLMINGKPVRQDREGDFTKAQNLEEHAKALEQEAVRLRNR